MNARYGWGQHQSTNGSSQYFDRQFFDAIFGEDLFRIGETNQDSKHDVIPFISHSMNRWCYYELCVLGDPTLDMWTDFPWVMALNHSGGIVVGSPYFDVTVVGIEGALSSVDFVSTGIGAFAVGRVLSDVVGMFGKKGGPGPG